MTKTQRLRNTADGLMAGLVMAGYCGPWRWSHMTWEGSFYRVWRAWQPPQRDPSKFPRFEIGGHGSSSQARDMLWQLKSTSPFTNYERTPLPQDPFGLTPAEFIEIHVEGASPAEWQELAMAFLTELSRWVEVEMADGTKLAN